MSAEAAPLVASPTRPVALDAVERELAALWESAEGEPPLTRACMSNLVVFCAGRAQAQAASHALPEIVQAHPARVVLLLAEEADPPPELEASVSALCYLAGGGRHVCSEQVRLRAGGRSLRRLPSAARALLVGDLPTTLWWAAPEAPPLRPEIFEELASLADQIVYDSRGWPDPARGVVATAEWAESGEAARPVADLAWRSAKPWRRLIAQSLDPDLAPGALASIAELVVEHGPHALPQAWLLIGWLAHHLGWRPDAGEVEPGVEVTWGFSSPQGSLRATVRRRSAGPAELRSVALTWREGARRATATFAPLDEGRLAVRRVAGGDPVAVLATPARDPAALLARQLSNRARESLFRHTLRVSAAMAEVLVR